VWHGEGSRIIGQERQAVRGAAKEGHEQAARGFDCQLAQLLQQGGKKSGKGRGGSKSQKRAAGREGGRKSSKS
jgi:hypothetical protein